MKDHDNFCYEIFKNIAVWSKNGKIDYNPCSFYSGFIKQTDQVELDKVWNQTEHRDIMSQSQNNIPIPGCRACNKADQSGLPSRRQGSKQLYENYHQDVNISLDGPQGLDYSVGNLCNLKCMICGPDNSTAWIPDFKKLNPTVKIEQYNKNYQVVMSNPELLKNIKSIHFHGGGEPLLSSHHLELLTTIKQVKGLADVRVFYNTNGTVRASDQELAMWEECKLVELYFSIDDVGNRFNYQRTGADWIKVQENLEWYKQSMPHNHMFNINCVWGYLNLYYLNELVDWYKNNFATNRYGDPTNLIFQKAIGNFSINHVSLNIHKQLLDRFEDYPELCELINSLTIDNYKDHSNFIQHVSQIDRIRGNQFNDICPEWGNLL
jgi:hypothetical protein